MKEKKMRILAALCAAMMLASVSPAAVLGAQDKAAPKPTASQSSTTQKKTLQKVVTSRYYTDSAISFSITGNKLTITGKPEDNKIAGTFAFTNKDTKKEGKQYNLSFTKDGFTSTVDLSTMTPGNYFLVIYYKDKTTNEYWSTLYNGLEIEVGKDKSSFAIPEMLGHNQAMFKNNQEALLRPSERGLKAPNTAAAKKAKEITKDCKTDYEKALVICDWIASNIYYDWDSFRTGRSVSNNSGDVFTTGLAKCDGFTSLATEMFTAADIPSRVGKGHTIWPMNGQVWQGRNLDASNHSWNELYIDGRWMLVDVTWMSQNRFENGKKITRPITHLYFDQDMTMFSYDHRIISYEKTE